MAALTIRNLYKRFGKNVETLKNVNIAINSGEFLILVGPSGCGKSTLMNMIAGLEEVSAGDILIDGKEVTHTPPKDRDISMVFQSYALYPNMTVRDNIAFGLQIRKLPAAEIAAEVARVAKLLQIDHLLERKPAQLSGGQQQRVAMGRALARRPKIYLFDEPLSNLDAKLRVEMRTEVKKLHRRLGTTIVYVTHDQIEAMTLADRIAVMKDGVVQQLGTPEEIYERPANLFVAGFIGSPPMNQIPIDVSEAQGKVVALLTGSDGQRMALPLGDGYRHLLGQSLLLGLRPEAITEVQPHRFDHASVCREHFTVIMTEPTGPDILTLVQLNGVEVCARLAPQAAPVIGQPVELMFDSARALLFDPASQQRLAPQQDRAAA